MEDKSPPFSWWMQNVQLTSDRCHIISNPNSDSFAGSALASTAVLCAQVWHSPGVSSVAKPARKCSIFPSSLWWFLTPQTQCQTSNSYQSSSPRASWTTQVTLSPTSTSQETHPHSFKCRSTWPLCSGCAFITAQMGRLGQPCLYPDGFAMCSGRYEPASLAGLSRKIN